MTEMLLFCPVFKGPFVDVSGTDGTRTEADAAIGGSNPRTAADVRPLYFQLKDARQAARSDERSVVPGEFLSLSPKWREVSTCARQILDNHGKDIEVLAWLCEAQLRLNGFEGLRFVFSEMAGLFETAFDALHSIGDGDLEDKVAPLAGLNGVGSEGTLIQAIRLVPLVPGGNFAQNSLWDYQLSQRESEQALKERLQDAVEEAGTAAMVRQHEAVLGCIKAFDDVTKALDAACGTEAPPSRNIRTVLEEAAAAIRMLAGVSGDVHGEEEPVSEPGGTEPGVESQPPAAVSVRTGKLDISSREEAFEALEAIARYFRKSEPHSPMAASIDTLVRRGRMDFADLLTELLPDPETRRRILVAAGIQPPSDGQNSPS
ncbi:type VI secretion system protein TssA [Fulvimarina sp. MAC8]|uniref:type VI secretion system protein TssA n=1 Tax=Fulvimarina sp. MAC8 TaxID=3162874 RepID=UPI0032EAD402